MGIETHFYLYWVSQRKFQECGRHGTFLGCGREFFREFYISDKVHLQPPSVSLIRRFEEIGSTMDKRKSGRPEPPGTDENVSASL